MRFLQSALSVVLLVPAFASAQSCPSGWTASASVPGKCYKVLSGFDADSTYYDLVFGCVQAGNGAGDILAIANGFEDTELGQFLSNNGLSNGAIIGVAKANDQIYWLSQAGFTSYWPTIADTDDSYAPFAWLDGQGTITIYTGDPDDVPDSAVCQLYPGNSSYARNYANCPDGFVQSVTVPGKCYYNDGDLPEELDFDDATAFCAQQGAELLQLRGGYPEIVEAYWATDGIPWLNYVQGNDSTWQWLGSNPPPANFSLDLDDAGEDGTCSIVAWYVDPTSVDCGDVDDPQGFPLVPLCELYPGGAPPTFPTFPTGGPTPSSSGQSTGGPSNCPDDWLSSSYSSIKCLATIEQLVRFEKAQELCQILHDEHSDLLAINGAAEAGTVGSNAGANANDFYWVGLQTFNGYDWQWTSLTGGAVTWAPGQPDTSTFSNHTCGAIKGSQIYAQDCYVNNKVLCELLL